MSIQTIIELIAGLVLLVIGAEGLVRGAVRLAAMLGTPPLIIGLTIVAYGTSAPEMFVSLQSSLSGNADIALGNVVGSNIFNVLFVLGLSALVTPLIVAQQLIRLDVPIMIGVSFLLQLLALDGVLNRAEGVFLFMGGIGYTLFLIWYSRKESNTAVQEEYAQEYSFQSSRPGLQWLVNLGFIAGGLLLLALGSDWLISSSTALAESFGVSQLIIGLTIVAAGTSLPELATSVIASFRGERDIAVGNVVGSNIFNILAVLGVAAMASPTGIQVASSALRFDIPVMIAVAIICFPIFFTGNVICRWEAVLFLVYYGAYTGYLILAAAQHNALPMFSNVLGQFVIPITAATLAFVWWHDWRRSHKSP
jgi:cation:H+ antiporter